ncbi:MAG TPA: ABC transporter ATP-binding protein [Candidatus Thermoplasmatota archaeon]|nr:ABC transporter ATP-binding protein [Candidatus Thermoplasmatota archaeon]
MADRASDAFVRATGLGRSFGAEWAIRGLDFSVPRGEIFGIIGPNGAGKTTTLKILAGLLAPTEGDVRVGGLAVSDPAHRLRIGYLPEESPLYEDMTPRAYLRFFADLYGVPRATADERIEAALARLDLAVRDEKRIGDMSKGMRRKTAIARALVNDPDLLLFDEPASGLDPVVSATILDLVRELRRQGKTVILSAHNLYHVERVCDRILLLRRGAELAQGSMAEIRAAVGGTEYVVRTSVAVEGSAPGEEGFELTVASLEVVHDVERRAKDAGGRVLAVRTKDLSLEEIFLRKAAR